MTECRFFICFVVKLLFCDLNSSTTVEVDRGQDLHTTEVSGCDLLGLHRAVVIFSGFTPMLINSFFTRSARLSESHMLCSGVPVALSA